MRVLFIIDGSLTNPVVSSQGFPQLSRLAEMGYEIYVLSVEGNRHPENREKYRRVVKKYSGIIHLLPLRLLPERFLRKQVQLLLFGPFATLYYVVRYGISCIHARSYAPAVLGLLAKRLLGVTFLFDMRGLFVEEYISRGSAKEGDLTVSIMRFFERKCILGADEIVVVSEQFKRHVLELPYVVRRKSELRVSVIPTCVDSSRFECDPDTICRLRRQYGLEDRTVIVYSGSLSSWQLSAEIAPFFAFCLELREQLHLLILTYSDTAGLADHFRRQNIQDSLVTILEAGFDDVPKFLQLARAGLIFRKEELLNHVACPLKFAEYLAAGVAPVLTNGIGDTGDIVAEHKVGVIVKSLSEEDLRDAARKMFELLDNDPTALAARCREVARRSFSMSRSVELYDEIYRRLQ